MITDLNRTLNEALITINRPLTTDMLLMTWYMTLTRRKLNMKTLSD